MGGYWIDPPLERVADVSPTSSHFGFGPESYDIMERDGEAKIYHEFFRSRVSKLCSKSQETYLLCCTYISHLFLFPVPSLFHSSGSIFRAPGSLCVFGGGGE